MATNNKALLDADKQFEAISEQFQTLQILNENGEIVKKAGKPVADTSLRDTENVPLDEDIDRYFKI